MNEEKITKNESYGNLPEDDVEYLRDEEDYSLSINQSGKKVSDRRGKEVVSTKKAKKGSMDLYMFQGSQKQQGQAGGSKFRQTNISDACDKEIRGRTIQHIARFFYQVGLPLSTTRLDSFKEMIEAIERYGAGLKPPSYYEMRVPLL
ncbi:unnamed protein product [Musa textilis]